MSYLFGSRKGFVGEIIIFLFAVTLVAIVILSLHGVEAENVGLISKGDFESSAAVIAEAVVNSPDCLLYTETLDIWGNKLMDSRRNVIDWSKAEDIDYQCVSKPPYVWKFQVSDFDSILSPVTPSMVTNCIRNDYEKTIQVKIVRDGELHEGEVKFYFGSFDFILASEDRGDEYIITIRNAGNCGMKYNLEVYTVDTETGDRTGFGEVELGILYDPRNYIVAYEYDYTTSRISVRDGYVMHIKPKVISEGDYALVVEASPLLDSLYGEGLGPDYKKTIREEL